jgi:hypothetical protein
MEIDAHVVSIHWEIKEEIQAKSRLIN